ncbi:YezD family protein [Anaerocolumna sp. AGMB13025]|uniref:YezD family protein n=1 Tax=Anaerocolumna sp. AGMB13025 TaxID=3039116 RepID=UPI00241D96AF|nr:YezD family protein [Anaerocolumna sp. AGMB13025]WFR54781.1 YezD family protein [Anaerocolumna sp. AGMB13025]
MEDSKGNIVKKNTVNEKDIQKIIEFIETIQFGSIMLIIQDGRIVQIEKNEKVRFK